jgi:hypothetical protein
MSDKYILRSGAIDAIKRNAGTLYTREAEFLFRKVISLLKNAPAADAVPVVRCKGCKYYRNHPNGLCYLHTEPTENERGYSGEAVCVEPDDFCSYGERREE